MSNQLDIEYKFYCDNEAEFIKQYDGKALIIRNKKVVGCYATKKEAYDRAIEKYKLGTFLIQKCSSDPEDNIVRIYSRVIRVGKRTSHGPFISTQ